MDTQLLTDLPSRVFKQFNKMMCFRLPYSDAKTLLKKATIPDKYLYELTQIEVGVGMYIANGNFQYPIFTMPTLHKKSEPHFDVFVYLENKFGIKNYQNSQFLRLSLENET
jgi:hypothetical protein